jgi:hypothetical protein
MRERITTTSPPTINWSTLLIKGHPMVMNPLPSLIQSLWCTTHNVIEEDHHTHIMNKYKTNIYFGS